MPDIELTPATMRKHHCKCRQQGLITSDTHQVGGHTVRHSPGSAAEFRVTEPQAAARPPRRLPGARRGFIGKHALNMVMFLRALMTLEILWVDLIRKECSFDVW